jgi:hypothetical protein
MANVIPDRVVTDIDSTRLGFLTAAHGAILGGCVI